MMRIAMGCWALKPIGTFSQAMPMPCARYQTPWDRNRFDAETRQFMHPVGIVFSTPSGKISSYLLGVGYQPSDASRSHGQRRKAHLPRHNPSYSSVFTTTLLQGGTRWRS